MLDAGEVGLRREGKQVVGIPIGSSGQQMIEVWLVDPKLRRRQRRIGQGCSASQGELTDAVDRIVIVDRQQQPCAWRNR